MKYLKGGSIGLTQEIFINLIETAAKSKSQDKFDLEVMGVSSVGGYVFKIKSAELDEVKTVFGGSNTPLVNGCEIIMKVVQLYDTSTPNKASSFNKKEISTIATFDREVYIQNDIWNRSMNYDFEPICPQIIDSQKSTPNGKILKYLLKSIKSSKAKTDLINILDSYRNYIIAHTPRTVSFIDDNYAMYGFIFMEFMKGSKSIKSVFGTSRYDAIRNNNPHFYNSSQLRHDEKIVLDNYLYTLCRLYRLGYYHGDTHLENALLYDNYNYIDGYRVFLIDFGRTKKIQSYNNSYIDLNIIISDVNNWWSYQQMKNFASEKETYHGSLLAYYQYMKNHYIQPSLNMFYANIRSNVVLRNELENIFNLFDPNFTYNSIINTSYFQGLNDINISTDIHSIRNQINVSNCCPIIIDGRQQYITPTIYDYNFDFIHGNYTYNNIRIIEPSVNYIQNINPSNPRYLWIIGTGKNGTGLYMMEYTNCFEITNKDYILAYYSGITSLYASGQIMILDDTIRFNLESKTYMTPSLQNGLINVAQRNSMNNIVKLFIEKTFNNSAKKYKVVNSLVIDCCDPAYIEYQMRMLERIGDVYYSQIGLFKNQRMIEFNTKEGCEDKMRVHESNLRLMDKEQEEAQDEDDEMDIQDRINRLSRCEDKLTSECIIAGGAITNTDTNLNLKNDEISSKNVYEIEIKDKSIQSAVNFEDHFNLNTVNEPILFKDEEGNVINILEEMKKNELFKDNMICLHNLMFKKKIDAVNLKIEINNKIVDELKGKADELKGEAESNKPIDYTKLVAEPSHQLEDVNMQSEQIYGGLYKNKKKNKKRTQKQKHKLKHRTQKYKKRKNKITKRRKHFSKKR